MKQNQPNAHRSQIKMCEKRQTLNVQFRFMQNAFRILKPIQKSSICVSVFRNTGANAFAKIQMRLAYEDKRDLYCSMSQLWDHNLYLYIRMAVFFYVSHLRCPIKQGRAVDIQYKARYVYIYLLGICAIITTGKTLPTTNWQ